MGAATVERIDVVVCTVPTDAPESDGTFEWDATTIVIVRASGAGRTGIGYTYTASAAARLIRELLAPHVIGGDVTRPTAAWHRMRHAIRNIGRAGVASAAIAAVDVALWDLKARVLGLPLVTLLGQVRDSVPVYGSGGFTSYTSDQLIHQLERWVADGITRVKIKVGRHPAADDARVRTARTAIGMGAELFVDANGAYTRKQALGLAARFAESDVTWFEEPVSSDDLAGLRMLRDRAPASIDIAAGEYGCDVVYFRRMLEAGSVDVLQIDATRCGGITGLMHAAQLAAAFGVPTSAHTAPALHLHPCCALAGIRHVEYFHDHARLEPMLFDGVVTPRDGTLAPDLSREGNGLELRDADIRNFIVDA